MKLTYADKGHLYYLDGVRATSVTSVAKIPIDRFTLEMYDNRMVATGVTIDPNIRENIAAHIDDRDRVNEECKKAKEAAKAHLKADRGTQKHRVLELVLLDQEHKLITDQQRADAVILKRTMDRYHLVPYDYLTEQFVVWPHYTVTGRFDAVLERPDGSLCLVDLKAGENSILYPLQTEIQLALYARAPYISDNIQSVMERGTRKAVVTDWRQMPERLDRRYAYVMLVDNDSDVGTLHEMDIEHGWAGAQIALNALEWRKKFNKGKDTVREITEWEKRPELPTWKSLAEVAETVEDLRMIWKRAAEGGTLTDELKALLTARSNVVTTNGDAFVATVPLESMLAKWGRE